MRIVRGEYDRWLSDAILVEDKSKQIVAVSFALEAESPLCLLVRGLGAVLPRTLHLACLYHSFPRVESRTALVSKLYGAVVVEVKVCGSNAYVSRTNLHSAAEARNLVPQVFQSGTI